MKNYIEPECHAMEMELWQMLCASFDLLDSTELLDYEEIEVI